MHEFHPRPNLHSHYKPIAIIADQVQSNAADRGIYVCSRELADGFFLYNESAYIMPLGDAFGFIHAEFAAPGEPF